MMSRDKMKLLIKVSITVIFNFFIIISLNLLAFIYLKYFGNPIDRSSFLLETKQELGWGQKSDLNTSFYQTKVFTDNEGFRNENKSPSEFSIWTLGPSSAFGWGVELEETYSSLLTPYASSINLSQIGYSSYQGYQLTKKVLGRFSPPKIAVLAYGVNDLDHFRFFHRKNGADKNILPMLTDKGSDLNFSLIKLIKKMTGSFSRTTECGSLKFFTSYPDSINRVSLDDFVQNYTALIEIFKAQETKLIIVNTPYMSEEKFSSQEFEAHMKKYSSISHLASKGNCTEAWNQFKLIRENEPLRVAYEVEIYNAELEKLAKKYDLIYIDAHKLLTSVEKNYVDPVHPSAIGHKLISQSILDQLGKNND